MSAQPASSVAIRATGAACAVGLGVRQICASIQAGLGRIAESSLWDGGEPVRMALFPEGSLEPLHSALAARRFPAPVRRLLRLASPALREAAAACPPDAPPVPLFLGLREGALSGGIPAPALLDALAKQAAVAVDLQLSQTFPRGRAAALLALDAAARVLQQRQADLVLVGGIDTHFDPVLLADLTAEKRLLSQRVADGFIPGEGAAFLLLSRAHGTRPAPGELSVGVLSTGTARDPGHRFSDQPARGEGLSQAMERLVAGLSSRDLSVRSVFAGFNGENFDAKEWGVARLRFADLFAVEATMQHPADCYGDAGAATGALLLAIAHHQLQRGERPGPALVFASSDREERACALLDVLT